MNLEIERMILENFKGAVGLTYDFGHVTEVRGRNGLGKTTIPDAFCWVLFDKDSAGNAPGSAFRVKPLDAEGHEIHGLETAVELRCRLDGQPFNLKRVQKENWVKKRGNAEAVFQGNASTYYVNDVGVTQTEFKKRISAIVPEDTFRLLGILGGFNVMPDAKKREKLLAMAGEDPEEALLAREEYAPLKAMCDERGVKVDELKKIIRDNRLITNREIDALPVRIDEATRALPDVTAADAEAAKAKQKALTAELEQNTKALAELRAAAAQESGAVELMRLKAQRQTMAENYMREYSSKTRAANLELETAKQDLQRQTARLSQIESDRAATEKAWADAVHRRDGLRQEYNEAYQQTFDWPEEKDVCPTCGQALPEEMREQMREAARAKFLEGRKACLLRIQEMGKDAAAIAEEMEKRLKALDSDREETAQKVADVQEAVQRMEAELASLKAVDPLENPEMRALNEQIAALEANRTTGESPEIMAMSGRITALQADREKCVEVLTKWAAGQETEKRIRALRQQQEEMAERAAGLEKTLALIEDFTREKCAMLEDGINRLFPTIRWRLFETQINGGLAEVCQAMVPSANGAMVDYGAANQAARVNADIEIVNVLGRSAGVHIPLFADRSESVNDMAAADGQMIRLRVTDDAALVILRDDEIPAYSDDKTDAA